jgi:hypothetical protein
MLEHEIDIAINWLGDEVKMRLVLPYVEKYYVVKNFKTVLRSIIQDKLRAGAYKDAPALLFGYNRPSEDYFEIHLETDCLPLREIAEAFKKINVDAYMNIPEYKRVFITEGRVEIHNTSAKGYIAPIVLYRTWNANITTGVKYPLNIQKAGV